MATAVLAAVLGAFIIIMVIDLFKALQRYEEQKYELGSRSRLLKEIDGHDKD